MNYYHKQRIIYRMILMYKESVRSLVSDIGDFAYYPNIEAIEFLERYVV